MDFNKIILLAVFIVTAVGLTAGLQGCSKNYSIKNFTELTGKKWSSLSQEEKKQYKISWDVLEKDEQIELFQIYGNNPEVHKYHENIDYDSLPQEHKLECKKCFPWINLDNPSEGDKTFIKYIGFAESAIQH